MHKEGNRCIPNPSIISIQLVSKLRVSLENITKAPRAEAEVVLPVSGVLDLDRLPCTERAFYQPNCSTQEQPSIEQFRPHSTVHHRHTVRHQQAKQKRHGSSADREQKRIAAQNELRGRRWICGKTRCSGTAQLRAPSYGEQQDAAEQLNFELKNYCPFTGQHKI